MSEREYLQCPKCGSKMVETTTLGHLGPRTNDPNKATCQDCKRTGKAGDWWLIQELRAQLAKAVTAYFARPFIEAPPLHKSMEDYEREMRDKLDQFRHGRM